MPFQMTGNAFLSTTNIYRLEDRKNIRKDDCIKSVLQKTFKRVFASVQTNPERKKNNGI